ncbi:ABC transporter permease [Longispora fulva]|uniref:Multiple sugar transport system permease protein n=1 Tax=Longispora fulva TaxID=619741 RepID=A0A8J7GFS4_9ACTN|nr:carbohydrate ABC transporter permease [Longispora fulva]MBG6136991.1 multiple sugar transport system permease protein [Longispora fulva]GIG61656.1 ABC transporter permease [Longispora fulva]
MAATPHRIRASRALTAVMTLALVYAFLPLVWLLVSATKTQSSLLTSFGLWFDGPFALWDNVGETLTYHDGVFVRWLLNTLLYVVAGAGGATALATLAGYGLSKFAFPGRRGVISVVLAAVAVPSTALAVPTFLLFSRLGLTNTPWAVILPTMVSPFGMYLMWVFANESVPDSLLEAARIDGASELRTFRSVSLRLLSPGIVTVLLFNIVATWNNYFLPLVMLSDPEWFPLTVGLNQWNAQASTVAAQPIFHLVVTGSLLTIVPLAVCFLALQRYWRSGLAAGSVKQ